MTRDLAKAETEWQPVMEWMTGIKLKFDGLPLLRLLRAFHNCAAYGASAVVVSRTETYSIRLYSSSGKKAALTLYIPLTMFYAVWNTQCLRDLFCSIFRVLIFILIISVSFLL